MSGFGRFAIEVAIADLERALCRDRAHAIVAVPEGPEKALLLRTLAERLAGSHRVLNVHPSPGDEDDICTRVLVGLGEQPGPDAESRLLDVVGELSRRGSSLVLLLGDACAMQPTTLRRLGRLAAASRPGLRLALLVSSESGKRAGAMADVVAALGVGAEKIELDARVEPIDARTLATSEAPRSQPEEPAIRVSVSRNYATRRAGRLQRSFVAAGVALVLLGSYGLVSPSRSPGVASEPPPPPAPVDSVDAFRSAPPEEPPAPPPDLVASALSVDLPPPPEVVASAMPIEPLPELPEVVVPAGPEPVATPLPAAPQPAPVPQEQAREEKHEAPAEVATLTKPRPRLVRVNLNARPWARIEIDGKDVGVTPLAGLPLEPGMHLFRAHLPDGRVIERALRVDAHRDHISFP